ncbi:leucine-rich repeat-containing protein 34 [Polypterus senegalus]|uniref:leucine-rich repeat-containing protein 34 n=1 Tax=Polypterus senegalus TaxID=55291 RepID=UPI001963A5AE|nr:leucine-rich repeat-containing protein 34 [Polypterus senegalus]XP_039616965.1 leucine-rich repeat-containing protein 34 [Polypterus senegalus]
MAGLPSLEESYSAICSEMGLLRNPYIMEKLRLTDKDAAQTSSDVGVTVKIPGNTPIVPVPRVTDSDIVALAQAVNNTFVTGLDLRFNQLTDLGSQHLANLLKETVALRYLNLMCNDIGPQGAEMIAKALHRNETLKRLQLTGNKIGNIGAMSLASMLQINNCLEDLDVSDCDVDTQSLVAFATVLTWNKSLRIINLNRPLLFSQQEETTVHMAQMLKMNQHLIELHLGKHDMKDFGVERLSEALTFNFTLRYLDLRCNKITRDGAKCLSEYLKNNRPLEILDLTSNRIEDDGAIYLSEAISLFNTNLKALAITSNNITGKGLVALAEAMKINSSLSYIYIWGNKLDEPTCVAFSEMISCGRLPEEHTDVSPYVVDGQVYLAELSHGLRKHYYWTPSFGPDGDPVANSALALSAGM